MDKLDFENKIMDLILEYTDCDVKQLGGINSIELLVHKDSLPTIILNGTLLPKEEE